MSRLFPRAPPPAGSGLLPNPRKRQHVLHNRIRGYEGLEMVCKNYRKRNSFEFVCTSRKLERVSRVFARAYACVARESAAAAAEACMRRSVSCLRAIRGKPSLPSNFPLTQLKKENKNPRIYFSKPSPNPRNPRTALKMGGLILPRSKLPGGRNASENKARGSLGAYLPIYTHACARAGVRTMHTETRSQSTHKLPRGLISLGFRLAIEVLAKLPLLPIKLPQQKRFSFGTVFFRRGGGGSKVQEVSRPGPAPYSFADFFRANWFFRAGRQVLR